ncbi:hypothetical protein PF021_03330 [Helicobacter sp. A82]|uniref:Uncharacterized protein n=1 Tax=Helicobacter ibis TaxID=2962633 RepID=A0ABT4VDC3_9HELI|nr:hypothetical protein [Helicobacter ibis]
MKKAIKNTESKHFQKYKQGTLHMIKSLKFIPRKFRSFKSTEE